VAANLLGHAYIYFVFLAPWLPCKPLAAVSFMSSLLLCQQAQTGLEGVFDIVVVPVHIIVRCGADNHLAHAETVYRILFAG